jgi:aerobic-type carbon monoxide dehydrogenase small subunit (CoxS/CutS family)
MSKSSEPKGREGAGRALMGDAASLSRRSFLQGMGVAAGVAAVPLRLPGAPAQAPAQGGLGPAAARFTLRINGQNREITAEPRVTLAEVLRDRLDLTGTKIVCDRGACGCCTVMVDGQSVCSCMYLAVDARGAEVTTVEGLAKPDGTLDAVQEGFVEHDAQQCGFCTPGMVMRARAFLNENPTPSLDEIKRGMEGNICRCGTYTHVFQAIQYAAEKEA